MTVSEPAMPTYVSPNEINTEGLGYDPYEPVPVYSLRNPFNLIDIAIYRTTDSETRFQTARQAASFQSTKFHNSVKKLRLTHDLNKRLTLENKTLKRRVEEGIAGDRIKIAEINRRKEESKRQHALKNANESLIDVLKSKVAKLENAESEWKNRIGLMNNALRDVSWIFEKEGLGRCDFDDIFRESSEGQNHGKWTLNGRVYRLNGQNDSALAAALTQRDEELMLDCESEFLSCESTISQTKPDTYDFSNVSQQQVNFLSQSTPIRKCEKYLNSGFHYVSPVIANPYVNASDACTQTFETEVVMNDADRARLSELEKETALNDLLSE